MSSVEIVGEIKVVEIVGEVTATGATGASAYEIWLSMGNEGTEEDFLASLTAGEFTHIPASNVTESSDRVFITAEQKDYLINKQTYVHDQIMASATWTIDHPLKKFPSVNIVDSAGSLVEGDVEYISDSRVIVSFIAEFSGKAYLN
jgi:hypothetical protein